MRRLHVGELLPGLPVAAPGAASGRPAGGNRGGRLGGPGAARRATGAQSIMPGHPHEQPPADPGHHHGRSRRYRPRDHRQSVRPRRRHNGRGRWSSASVGRWTPRCALSAHLCAFTRPRSRTIAQTGDQADCLDLVDLANIDIEQLGRVAGLGRGRSGRLRVSRDGRLSWRLRTSRRDRHRSP